MGNVFHALIKLLDSHDFKLSESKREKEVERERGGERGRERDRETVSEGERDI